MDEDGVPDGSERTRLDEHGVTEVIRREEMRTEY